LCSQGIGVRESVKMAQWVTILSRSNVAIVLAA
jgi:hypothetical protein